MSKQVENRGDEINFEPVVKYTVRFFDFVYRFLKTIVFTMLQNPIKLMVGFLIGALLAVGLSYTLKPYYTLSYTFNSSLYNHGFFVSQIDNIHQAILDENYGVLVNELGISEGEAQKIHDVSIVYEPPVMLGDSQRVQSFTVSVDVYSTEVAERIEKGIHTFLEQNEYAQEIKARRKQSLEKMIEKIRLDIAGVDSLVGIVAKGIIPRSEQRGFIYGEPINPTSLIAYGQQLYQKQLDYESELQFIDHIKLIKKSFVRTKPDFPKKSYFAIIGGAVAFMISFVVLYIKKGAKL